MTRARELLALRGAMLGLLALLACGDPDPPQQWLWAETFEEVCDDDLPCGWEQTGGAPGDARFVMSSFLSGEHALLLSGDAAVRGPGDDVDFAIYTSGALAARFVGRCDPDTAVRIVVGLAEGDGTGLLTGRVDQSMERDVYLPESWTDEPVGTLLVGEGYFDDAGIGMAGYTNSLQVTSVLLTKVGPGSCEIAELLIDDAGTTARTVPEGC